MSMSARVLTESLLLQLKAGILREASASKLESEWCAAAWRSRHARYTQ